MIKKLLVLFGLITVNAFCDPTYTNKEQVLACMRRRNYPNFHIQEKDIVPDTIEAIKAALEVRDFECVVHGKRLSPDKIELVLKLRSRLKRLYFVEEQTSETVGYIAEMLSRNGGLTSLTLECSPIDDDNAKLIAEALKTNTTLTLLTLGRCNMTDVGARYMAEALKINTTLRTFRLSSNNISDVGAGYIAEALNVNTVLRELYLSSKNIGNVGARHIAEALKTNTTLAVLTLERCKIGNVGAQHIAKALEINTTLRVLDLSDSVINDRGASRLFQVVSNHDIPEKFRLKMGFKYSNCTIKNGFLKKAVKDLIMPRLLLTGVNVGENLENLKYLNVFLYSNSTIAKLVLRKCNLDVSAMDDIAKALKMNSTITELDLSGNKIGNTGKVTGVWVPETVGYLIWCEKPIAEKFWEALGENSTLTKLNLAGNGIHDGCVPCMVDGLKKNSVLTDLNLRANHITDASVEFVKELLKNNRTLTSIDLSKNHISNRVTPYFYKALENNTTLTRFDYNCEIQELMKDPAKKEIWVQTTFDNKRIDYVGGDADKGLTPWLKKDPISEALKTNTTLRMIDLAARSSAPKAMPDWEYNSMDDKGISPWEICGGAPEPEGGVSEGGLSMLSAALRTNTTLGMIDFAAESSVSQAIPDGGHLSMDDKGVSPEEICEVARERGKEPKASLSMLSAALKANTLLGAMDFSAESMEGVAGAPQAMSTLGYNSIDASEEICEDALEFGGRVRGREEEDELLEGEKEAKKPHLQEQ